MKFKLNNRALNVYSAVAIGLIGGLLSYKVMDTEDRLNRTIEVHDNNAYYGNKFNHEVRERLEKLEKNN